MKGAWIVPIVFAAACVHEAARVPSLDPRATFAAHRVHGGFEIDRLASGQSGRIDADGAFSRRPRYTIRIDGAPAAELWKNGPASVTMRTTDGVDRPPILAIEPSWEEQAIRL